MEKENKSVQDLNDKELLEILEHLQVNAPTIFKAVIVIINELIKTFDDGKVSIIEILHIVKLIKNLIK